MPDCVTAHIVRRMTSAYEQGTVPPIEVKHRLRIAREYAGLDQEQLAARSGIARATISNAETGHGTPRRTTLNAWALATGVPVSWIIGERPSGGDGDGLLRPDNGAAVDPTLPTNGLRMLTLVTSPPPIKKAA